MKKCLILSMILLAAVVLLNAKEYKDGLYAEIETSKGTIVIQLEFEKVPMTVANFVGLAEGKIKNEAKPEGTPYYDGIVFHRVIPKFMIQSGDPTGTGTGGPGYAFPDEFDNSLKHNRGGILSMANPGPNSNGSQFFITHNSTSWLNGKHAVFGHTVDGMAVVHSIKKGDVIKHIEIVRVGEAAKKFIVTDASFKKMVADAEKN